ncbi:MAG TPA: hypothetical protein VK961_01555, partial [Chthoniobacter sp.]|nr:hypothetical protein [Chthoniobacter sp.]
TRVVGDAGHHIPANLAVTSGRQGSTTQIDGSRIKHDVNYTDADFSADGLKDMTVPKGGTE